MPQVSISPRRAKAMTAALGLLTIFPPLATDMYLAAIGDVADSLQTTRTAAELSLSLFFLGLCIGQLIMGPLIDSFGRKTPLLIGVGLFVITSIALVVVDDIRIFNTLRVFQAIGACAGMVVSRAIVNDLYEGTEAAKVMTVLVMMLTVGPIVSPTLGSLLLESFGWRSIFVVIVIIGLVAFTVTLRLVPETLPKRARKPASLGAAGKAFGTLLAKRDFMVSALIAGCVQAGMFAFITGSSGVFQGIFGLSALQYGMLFAIIAIALMLFGQVNKTLLNRYSPAQILKTGIWFYVATTLLLVLSSGTHLLALYVVPLWISIGMVGLLSANAMSLAMGAAGDGSGVASALLGAVQFAVAFTVSTCVATFGAGSPLAMALGLCLPCAVAAFLLKLQHRDTMTNMSKTT